MPEIRNQDEHDSVKEENPNEADEEPNSPSSPTSSPKTKKLEKKKAPNKKARKVIRKKLKQYLWALSYPTLFQAYVAKTIDERRKRFEKGKQKKIQNLATVVLEYFKSNCHNSLYQLYKDPKSIILINEGTNPKKHLKEKQTLKNFTTLAVKFFF